jgi:hypothetical protein
MTLLRTDEACCVSGPSLYPPPKSEKTEIKNAITLIRTHSIA